MEKDINENMEKDINESINEDVKVSNFIQDIIEQDLESGKVKRFIPGFLPNQTVIYTLATQKPSVLISEWQKNIMDCAICALTTQILQRKISSTLNQ